MSTKIDSESEQQHLLDKHEGAAFAKKQLLQENQSTSPPPSPLDKEALEEKKEEEREKTGLALLVAEAGAAAIEVADGIASLVEDSRKALTRSKTFMTIVGPIFAAIGGIFSIGESILETYEETKEAIEKKDYWGAVKSAGMCFIETSLTVFATVAFFLLAPMTAFAAVITLTGWLVCEELEALRKNYHERQEIHSKINELHSEKKVLDTELSDERKNLQNPFEDKKVVGKRIEIIEKKIELNTINLEIQKEKLIINKAEMKTSALKLLAYTVGIVFVTACLFVPPIGLIVAAVASICSTIAFFFGSRKLVKTKAQAEKNAKAQEDKKSENETMLKDLEKPKHVLEDNAHIQQAATVALTHAQAPIVEEKSMPAENQTTEQAQPEKIKTLKEEAPAPEEKTSEQEKAEPIPSEETPHM